MPPLCDFLTDPRRGIIDSKASRRASPGLIATCRDIEGPSMPPVRIYTMGIHQWRDEQEWPLGRTKYIPVLSWQQRRRQLRPGRWQTYAGTCER